ncbi:MAG: hypothetical protein AAF909_11420, partial [Pseudomonadota bacterium]
MRTALQTEQDPASDAERRSLAAGAASRRSSSLIAGLLTFGRDALSAGLTLLTATLLATNARLSMGPISLDGLAPQLERVISDALAEAAPGWRAEIGGLRVAQSPENGAGLRLSEVALRDPRGDVAFQAEEIGLALNPLAEGVVTGVRLIGAEAVVARDVEGRWRFAVNSVGGAARGEGSGPTAGGPPGLSAFAPDNTGDIEAALGDDISDPLARNLRATAR